MRPIKISIAPVTIKAAGFNANALTGAGPWTPTTTATADGLGHKVSIVSTSNLSGLSFTLTGTDVDGNAITETGLTGPNNATVTGTKYFKTLTGVSSSTTAGAATFGLGHAAASVSQTIPIEWRSNASASLMADISGTINFTPQQIAANIFDIASPSNSAAWSQAIAAGTADVAGTATLGSTAVRILTNTVTDTATLDFYISQPSGYPS
jgi:hypothetical protein